MPRPQVPFLDDVEALRDVPRNYTLTLNRGCKAPTTEGARGCCLSVESGHRSFEPRGEQLEYHTREASIS